MTKSRWQLWGLLALLLGIKVLLAVALTRSGLIVTSIDEYLRINWAWKWQLTKGYTSLEMWLPLFYYVYGLALELYNNLFWSPRIVNFFLSLATLYYVYRSSRMLQGTVHRAWAACFLLLALPFYHWLSLVTLSEMLFGTLALAGIYHYLRWQAQPRAGAAWCSALAICASSMVRYEGMMLAGLLGGYLLLQIVRKRANWPWRHLWIHACASAFILFWVIRQTVIYGTPWWYFQHFLDESAEFYQGNIPWNPLAIAIEQAPLMLLGLFLFIVRIKRHAEMARASGLILLWLLLMLLHPFFTGVPAVFPQRLMYPILLLLVPYVAAGFDFPQAEKPLVRAILPLAVGVSLMIALPKTLNYPMSPRVSQVGLQLGLQIRQLQQSGELAADERVIIEQHKDDWMLALISSRHNKQISWGYLETRGALLFDFPCRKPVKVGLLICRHNTFCRNFARKLKVRKIERFQDYFLIHGNAEIGREPDPSHCGGNQRLPQRVFPLQEGNE